jgi:putative phosphoribosyl transferase
MTEARLPYADRRQGGRVLAERLLDERDAPGLIVLALPRGGVEVGFEVAHALHAPLDVFVVRKLGHPGHEEYAVGAIASGGVRVMNPETSVPESAMAPIVAREQAELARRERLYRGDQPPLSLRGRTVIVVDDGLATGSTMRAAVAAIRQQQPAKLIAAVPVGAAPTCEMLRAEVDELVCPAMPHPFHAVGLWFRSFPQSTDEQVRDWLTAARQEYAAEHA